MGIFRVVSLIVMGFWLATAMTPPARAEQKLALVIGNDAYEHIPSLDRAVGDAKAVEAAFRRLGFTVTLATNVNFAAFAETVAAFEAKIEPGDEVAVHYSGHGIAIGGRNYLVPVDMIAPQPGQETLVAHLAVDAGALIDEIRERNPKLVFAILDACRNNPLAGTGRSIGNARGLARMEAQAGEFILFSAGPGEEALDRLGNDDRAETSVFTRVLLKHIETPGQSLQDLAKATQGEVRDLAAKVNHDQFPDYFDRTIDKPVLKEAAVSPTENLASAGEGMSQRKMADDASPAAPPVAMQPSAEIEFWQSIKGSTNKGDFAAYLEEFPKGTFAPLARARIAALEPAPPEKPKPPEPAPAGPDEVAWQRIVASTDPVDFESFARFFPDSVHKTEAEAAATSLRAKAQAKTAALEIAPPAMPEPPPPPACEGGLVAAVGNAGVAAASERCLKPKDVFRDCENCPEMVVIPAGGFTMGSPENEKDRFPDEGPRHDVRIAKPFAVGKFVVTVGEYASFAKATGHNSSGNCRAWNGNRYQEDRARSWRDPGYSQADDHPVACVSWEDAKAYVTWLAEKSGRDYRLLTEAEWEYAARAETRPGDYPPSLLFRQ
jgi:hypothetical protein